LITTETSLRLLEKLCNNQENPKIKKIFWINTNSIYFLMLTQL